MSTSKSESQARPNPSLRILSIGAFPFPYPQGSQVFAAAQARALTVAGADISLASYGTGEGELPGGLTWIPSSRALAPRSGRSGPSLAKPFADAALVSTVVRAQRARRFDVALAHNAEAAFVAAAVRGLTGLRFVYIAHTVMREELSAYGPRQLRSLLDRVGGVIDARAAAGANAVIALSEAGRRTLSPFARDEISVIPPGLELRDAPSEEAMHAACRDAGVEPRRFFLYCGNLDGYQDLELLDAAAQTLGETSKGEYGPVLVATHDASGAHRFQNLRVTELGDFASMRALQFAATALVATRRRTGGFPIKLLNYMEAARPIVAFEEVADGLIDGVSARLLDAGAGPDAIALALREFAETPTLGLELGAAAHEHLIAHHSWPDIAARTLGVAQRAARRGQYR